ncbi:MAG: PAS domain S-box protein [Xanthobacteraceae bacterium]
MKLSTRMALAMVALVLLTALSVGLLSYRNIRSAILPRAAERIEVHVRVLAATLAAAVRGAREDAAGFREAAAIAGIVRAHLAGGTDPEDGLTEAAWRERLARRFAAELAAKPTYNIFRLIDFADGRELVRVDRLGENGAIRVVPDGQLEDTSALDFFKAAHTTPAGEIYVSPVQLSLGRRRAVRIPVLRIATIVETPDHQPFGMAVINVDMQPILQELAASPQPGAHIYVVDSRGNYLVHPGPGRLFAADLGKPERWQDDFPTFAAALQSDAVKSSLLTDAQGEKTLVGLASVVLAGGPRVGILEVTPLSTVMAPITAVGKSTLLAGLTAVLCAALFAVLLARSMTRPLVQMTTAVEAFPRNPETVMPAATGEIGVLARAFARMMAEVKDKTASLEKEVADHRRTEAELERRTDRERLLSAAVQSSNDSIITLTSDGIVTSWNPAAVRLFGWTDKEMFGRSIDQIVPDDRHHEVPHIFDTIARGEILDNYQTVRLSKDGRAITVSLSVAPIKLASGSVIGACSVARDITESIKAKERIEQEMHERRRITGILDNTINSMADAVLVGDRDGNIVLCNAAAQRVMNIREGMTPAQWTYAQQIFMADGVTPMPLQERPLMRAVRGESFEDYELTVHYPHAGTPITFVATGGPIRAGSQQAAGGVVVYHDVSEARETERQLRQAQKMEAVGQLTGGVAHDFNNILTVITGTIEILEEGVADRPELAAIAKMIDDAAARGAELTNHLLAFSRRQPLQPRDTNVNALIMEVGRLLRPTLGGNIEIESMLDDNASSALIDPSQLTTSLLNLALNARDAMPGGGKLTFETTDAILDDNYAGMNEEVGPGPYVMIAVSDNGSGIAPDIIDKVFEPFFTTKVLGKGSGLGLSMVYGFVKQSGGHIKIYSEVGHGSTIKMYLPRAATMAQQFTDMAPAEPIHGGYETVLIVEDDALVRTYVTAQVRALGYRTLAATNAAEALTLIDGDTPIDLLFTDVVMPGTMNGRQLADETRRRRPGIKVLFTSGYAENAIVHHGRLDPGVLLLAKPYRKQQLAQMIRIALGAMDDDSGGDAVAGATRQRAV